MGIRPAKDLSSSHAPDTAEDSKPTAELPLLLRPVAALQPGISAAERSRSLYFRCKKQQKQLGASVGLAQVAEPRRRLRISSCQVGRRRTLPANCGALAAEANRRSAVMTCV
jgi:hypothetical protein